jgi:hypothetical protein
MDRCISIINLFPCYPGWDAAPHLLLASLAPWRETSLPAFLSRAEARAFQRRRAATVKRTSRGDGLTRRRKGANKERAVAPGLRTAPRREPRLFSDFFPDFCEFGACPYVVYANTHRHDIENITALSAQRRPVPRACISAPRIMSPMRANPMSHATKPTTMPAAQVQSQQHHPAAPPPKRGNYVAKNEFSRRNSPRQNPTARAGGYSPPEP